MTGHTAIPGARAVTPKPVEAECAGWVAFAVDVDVDCGLDFGLDQRDANRASIVGRFKWGRESVVSSLLGRSDEANHNC